MLMLNPIKAATAEISDPFGQDRAKSKPFKIVVNLEYLKNSTRRVLERLKLNMKTAVISI